MKAREAAWLQIHLCVLLWGFTAILGRLITLDALAIVLWRMSLVAAALALLPRVWQGVRAMNPRLVLAYAGIGILVACHWLTFYGAIKLANASVGATCMAVAPVFLAFLEPVLVSRPFLVREALLALLAVPGVMLVVGGTPESMNAGIAVGLLSALIVSFFSSFNKRLAHKGHPLTVTLLEMGAGALFLAIPAWLFPAMAPEGFRPQGTDITLLAILAFGCTLFPFALSLWALRRLSAYSVALAVNMEPLYAIILAILLLGEQREVDRVFYLGAGLILVAVIAHPLLAAVSHERSRLLHHG